MTTTTDDPRRKMPEFENISWNERRQYLQGMVQAWVISLVNHVGPVANIEIPLGDGRVAIIQVKEKDG